MALRLNRKYHLISTLFLLVVSAVAQEEMRPGDKDYKDKKQFEKFSKRRAAVGAWQINQLKNGALVVRLKTNSLLINSLIKDGNTILAKEKQLETDGVNLNTIRAYVYNYTFSKIYFMYSSSTDSLLNGTRKNIFLDTNLVIDPSIILTETFYLLAERDYAYNSTIGFVNEDSAKFVKEEGYGVKEMAVVVKNKYGHQLKKPFPYLSPDRPDFKVQSLHIVNIHLHGMNMPFNVGGFAKLKKAKSHQTEQVDKNSASFNYEGNRLTLFIPKYMTYERLSIAIGNFNEELKRYYRQNAYIGIERINPELKPFLY